MNNNSVFHILLSSIRFLIKAMVYACAWTCELTGRLLVTISDSLFKLVKR